VRRTDWNKNVELENAPTSPRQASSAHFLIEAQRSAHHSQLFQLHRAETHTRSQGVVAVREASWMVVGTPDVFQCLRGSLLLEVFSNKNLDEASTSENKR